MEIAIAIISIIFLIIGLITPYIIQAHELQKTKAKKEKENDINKLFNEPIKNEATYNVIIPTLFIDYPYYEPNNNTNNNEWYDNITYSDIYIANEIYNMFDSYNYFE